MGPPATAVASELCHDSLHPPARDKPAFAAMAARVEEMLARSGLSVERLSEATAGGLRGDRRLRIPRDLFGQIRSGQMPHVHQAVALCQLTGISLYDWLRTFGFDLEDLPVLQASLHHHRTIPLPTDVYDPDALIECPVLIDEEDRTSRSEFVAEIASHFEVRSAAALDRDAPSHFLYFKIGRRDAGLMPAIVPGTIVKVDTRECGPSSASLNTAVNAGVDAVRLSSRPIYVVATARGLTCTYIDWMDGRTIALVPNSHSVKPTLCRLEDEAIVLGRVCGELRPMVASVDEADKGGHDRSIGRVVRPDAEQQAFGRFLRSAREAIGLTLREAHEISCGVARAYGEPRFRIGVGTLSDWESQDQPPLHIAHVFSLAVCYAVRFGALLRAARLVDSDPFGPIAHGRATDCHRTRSSFPFAVGSGLPPALRHAARLTAGLSSLSWDDVFQCGSDAMVFDRSLAGARYLIVNRRDRRVGAASGSPTIDRPLYVLSDARGRQICSGCFAEGQHIYIQPDPRLRLTLRAVLRQRVAIRGRVLAAFRER